jgi:hypothetical protein
MASVIDNKKFELITRTENFDFAFDIYENFEMIKERLVLEFWDLLLIRFKSEITNSKVTERQGTDHAVDLTYKSLSNVTFYLGIYDSQFQYGIWFAHNGTKKKVQELEDLFKDRFEFYEYNEKEKLSWFFESEDEDFDSLHGLKKLLPEHRNGLIDKYFEDFTKMYDSQIKAIIDYYELVKQVKLR